MGSPVEHSRSPELHQAAYAQLGQPWSYAKREVGAEKLAEALQGLAGPELLGVNLTLPLKEAVLPLLQHMTTAAREVGAVNCLRLGEAGWEGHNSDAQGWLDSFWEEIGQPLSGRKVLILGAGGACRAVLAALRQQGAGPLVLFNRTVSRAQALLRPGECCKTYEEFSHELQAGCLVIQTTSLGMAPLAGAGPVEWPELLPEGIVACDLIYNPRPTRWLARARELGALTLDGSGMLVHQAARAIEWWSGIRPDPEPMRQALIQSLEG